MKRRIIEIDETLCNGCGACAKACHEGAIGMVGGKAKLLRDDYCDGLGDCLPTCPTGAIRFVEREAAAYDEAAVKKNLSAKSACPTCPGSISRESAEALQNWPVQIKLAPFTAPYFDGADLLIAADCTAFAYPHFHRDFARGKTVLIGCPKLDSIDYSRKLGMILQQNDVKSVTVLRMEVPCCGGLPFAVKNALEFSGKDIPLEIVTVSIDGNIMGN